MSKISKMNKRFDVGSANERQDKVQSSNVGKFTQYDRGGQSNVDKQENISSPRERLHSASRALASVAVALIAGLGMLPFLGSTAFAATSVTISSGPSPSPSSAGAPAVYTVGFTTSSSGALAAGSDTITLAGPTGTVFPSSATDYSVNGILASTVSGGGTDTATITTPTAIGDSTPVTVVANGVTNPPAGTYTLAVSTSSDTVAVSTGKYTISTGISGLTIAPENPVNSTQNSAPTNYTVTFDTSSTGALTGPTADSSLSPSYSPSATSTITLEAPSGEALPTNAASYLVNGVASVPNEGSSTTLPAPGASSNIETIGVPVAISGSSKVTVTVMGVTNPSTAGPNTWTAYTSTDSGPVTSAQYQITAQVTSPTASISTTAPSTDAAGKTGNYIFGFATAPSSDFTTASSANLAAGQGSITLSAASGTAFPSAASSYVISDTTSGHTFTAVASSVVSGGGSDSVTIITPDEIYAGDSVTVTVTGVTNPTPTSQLQTTSYTADISTSSDVTPLATGTYDVYTQPANVTVSVSNDLATTSANTQTANYTVTFDTSAIGALSSGDTITVVAPIATTSSDATSFSSSTATVNGIVASATPTSQSSLTSPAKVVVTVPTGVTVADGQGVTVVLAGVANPTTTGNLNLMVSTSTDQAPAPSSSYSLTAPSGSEVTGLSVSVSPSTTSSTAAQYSVSFDTSGASGGLPSGDTITLVAPSGTTLPSGCSDYTTSFTCSSVTVQGVNGSSTPNEAVITTGSTVTADTEVTITIASVTNPSVAGDYAFSVYTQVDTMPVTSNYYLIGSPNTAVGTPTVSLTPDTPTSSAVYTVTFQATNPLSAPVGSFSGGTITFCASSTTTTLTGTASDYTINGVVVPATPSSATCATGFAGYTVVSPVNIAAGETVTAVIAGVTNADVTSATTGTIDVSTSADMQSVASNGFTVYPTPTSVTSATVPSGFPTPDVTGESAQYEVQITVDHALSGSSSPAGTVTLDASTGAQGTVFPSAQSDYTIGGIQVAGVALRNSGQTVTLTLPSTVSVAASGSFTVVANGVTNPPLSSTSYKLDVSTSADQAPVLTNSYSIYSAVTGVSGPSPDTNGKGDPSIYTIGFTTTNALSSSDYIYIVDPSGKTTFSATTSAYVDGQPVTPTIPSSTSCTAGPTAPTGARCIKVPVPADIPADTQVWVVLPAADVTNPSTAGSTYQLEVSTTADAAFVLTRTYTIAVPPTPVTVASGAVSVSPTAAGVPADYTVDFTTSSTGALAAGTGKIKLYAPSGTVFPSSASDYIINNQTAAGVSGGGTATVTITTPVAVGNTGAVTLIADSVTNPSPGSYEMGISTSSDTAEVKNTDTAYDIIAPPAPQVTAVSPTSGPMTGGTSVTITGTNLTGATAVDFGTVAATNVTVVSSTSITAVSPAEQSGTVNVTVTTAGGTSATSSADQFTYKAVAPTVTAISPTSGPTTGGTSVTITGTGFLSGATVMFGTVTATAVTVSSATSITATSPAESAGTVNVTVTTTGGTSATSSADQFTYVTPITGDAYTPVNPARLADTRCSASPAPSYCAGENLPTANASLTSLAGGKSENVTVAGVDGVPLTATAVVINVTAVNMTTSGYFSIYPEGATPAVISSLNWTKNSGVVANLVTAPVNTSNGEITVANGASSNVNLIVDIEGYYAAPGSTPAGLYNSVTPSRLVDTRCSESPLPVGITSSYCASLPSANSKLTTLGASQTENVTVTGVGGIPSSGVSAVVLNLTAIGPTSGGYLTAFPAGATKAVVSTVDFSKGETTPNRVIVKVGSNGQISIYNFSGNTNFAVDVSGYYTDGSSSSQTGSLFNPVTPARILDTRCSQSPQPSYCSSENLPTANATLSAISGGKSISVQVAGEAKIPTDATAVVGNLTATGSTGSGYLTVYAGSTAPTTSDVNFSAGSTNANMVISGLNSSGQVNIANGGGQSVNALLDVSGWFTAATS